MANLEYYRVFYILAKTGSISKAAAELFVTQPAVSQSLSKLEDELKCTLFIRSPKGITLTADGQMLLSYVQPAVNSLLKAEAEFAKLQNLDTGEVRIGASDTICMYYLPEYLSRFQVLHPDIAIKVINRTSSEIITLLRNGLVDFGIVNMPLENDHNIVTRTADSIQDCFVAGKKFEMYKGEKLSREQIMSLPLILLEKGTATRRYVDDLLLKNGIRITPSLELGSVDLLVKFAVAGLGVAYVIKDYITDIIDSGDLFVMDFGFDIPKRNIGIATMKNIPLPAAPSAFVKMLLAKNKSSDTKGQYFK
ncbi:MAG TPA: LysR family transcriptional regulator [Clostridiales bacterium]|nr:LysR family transcriptional regulator [Clostridiales bacterium]